MKVFAFIACALMVGSLLGCGSSSDADEQLSPALPPAELPPDVLLERVNLQFDLMKGRDTPQGKVMLRKFPQGTVISCWQEGNDRVCGAAIPSYPTSGNSFARTLDYWDFYRATFDAGSLDPDIEQVNPEEALAPSQRAG